MMKEGFGTRGVAELVPVLVGEACSFIIVVAGRAFSVSDQHALPGQDQVHPGVLRGTLGFDRLKSFALGMADHVGDGRGMVDNIVRNI